MLLQFCVSCLSGRRRPWADVCHLCRSQFHHPCMCSSIYVSYGGLLMLIQGAADSLQHLHLDSHVYCLVRKAAV